MSRTIRRKNVRNCWHWEHKNFFKEYVHVGHPYPWSGAWIPIDKQEQPELWKMHWWKAHRDCDHRYDYGPSKSYRFQNEKSIRVKSRQQMNKALYDPEVDITVHLIHKDKWWDDYW